MSIFNAQDIFDSLSSDDKKRINDKAYKIASGRKQERCSRLEKAEINKQELVQKLERIKYEIAENDERIKEIYAAKTKGIEVSTEAENRHLKNAAELYSRKLAIDNSLPKATLLLQSLVADIENEEQQENFIQKKDKETLLKQIYEKRENEKSKKIAAQRQIIVEEQRKRAILQDQKWLEEMFEPLDIQTLHIKKAYQPERELSNEYPDALDGQIVDVIVAENDVRRYRSNGANRWLRLELGTTDKIYWTEERKKECGYL